MRNSFLSVRDPYAGDAQFESLLAILKDCPFQSLCVGEECGAWTWQTIMTALQYFQHVVHLAVHVGFEKRKMPNIKTEQKWLDFLGVHHVHVPKLQTLYCNDDGFLRYITSLASHREYAANNLVFVENVVKAQQYEKGSLKNRNRVIPQINTNIDAAPEDDDIFTALNGHYKSKTKQQIDKLCCALQYVRYRCQFAPEQELSGAEFDGAQIVELTPIDSMFVTIPCSAISFRISGGGSFHEDPDEYRIVVPFKNSLRELCIHSIENLKHVQAKYHLTSLQHLVIKRKPKDIESFKRCILRLCSKSPIQQITLLFMNNHRKKQNHEEHWHQLHVLNVKRVKDEGDLSAHPNLIHIQHHYSPPPEIEHISLDAKFTDYH